MFVFALAISMTTSSLAQISQPSTPKSFLYDHLDKDVPVEVMKDFDVQSLKEEDLALDTIKDIPPRFGHNLYVDINMEKNGKWEVLENGDKIWRLDISSPGAYTINLTFDNYHLPPGAELFVYNKERSSVLGAFTDFNNQNDGYFATTLIEGDFITLEYYEPSQASFSGELNLEMVTHAYRDPFQMAKGFGDSGWCNLNVACDEADGWEQQIRSVALMVVNGNGFCTGALINNSQHDETPLFLSANHCYSNPSSVVFWFNWQSENCENPTSPPPYDAMSGAVQRARNSASDFWLMELNQDIPLEYEPFYAGWNRSLDETLDETIIGVHHPSTDIKKFSYAEGGVQSASYLGSPGSGSTHWRIVWSGGTTTEPGSSGSPIFDEQGRILGQLHGGYAACGNTQPDWYGRLGVSWTGGGSSANRLSDWLDPTSSDVQVLAGFDPIDPGVENPLAFEATAQEPEKIQLEWVLNEEQDYVMVAVNSQNHFDNPEGGYTLGEEMEEGGQIIYLGNEESFEHSDLQENQTYYYKIWSYNADMQYSNGVTASAATPCLAVTDLPLFEGFNQEEVPACWQQDLIEGDTPWKIGVGNDDGYPFSPWEGESNVYFRTTSNEETGNISRLITPFIDLSPYQQATLSFYFANPASADNQDALKVYYNTGGETGWELLESFYSSVFSWENVLIELPELDSETRIAFEGNGANGRGISVDQVELFVSQGDNIPVAENLAINIINDNQPELTWEKGVYEADKEGPALGVNIYREDDLVFVGDDPEQTSFTDAALPVGEFTYLVKYRLQGDLLSEPSNEAVAVIAANGDEFTLEVDASGEGATFLPPGEYQYKPGSEVSIQALPAENHFLEQWLVNDDEQGDPDILTVIMEGDKHVEAVFQINQYELTLVAEPDGAATNLEGDGLYNHGEVVQLDVAPAVGYIFHHWKRGEQVVSTHPQAELVIAENTTLTAVFTDKEYMVELDVSPEDAGTIDGDGLYGAGAEVTITAEPNPGWLFENWTSEVDEEEVEVSTLPEYTFTVSEDVVLTANFDALNPELTVSVEGMGTTQPAEGTYEYSFGEEVTLDAIPDEGWDFVHWEVNQQEFDQAEVDIVLEEDTQAKAVFQLVNLLADETLSDRLKVYPIPASRVIHVEFPVEGIWHLQIMNVTGQLADSKTITSADGAVASISVDHLTPGIYLVKANSGHQVKHAKFVIE